ncbi:MAG: PadR family transcriptional regulator [Ilumatobacteraceae bacterium]
MRRHRISHSHHGRGHHRSRARRGAVRDAVLRLLDERPMHGYELITELDERSGGRWRPSAGTIYTALSRMEMRGLITSEEIDGKKRFSLTNEGREVLAEQRAGEEDDAPAPWDEAVRGGRGDLRRVISELVGQSRQIGRFGTAAQIERAAAVLDDAKRRLYAILAEPPEEPTDDAGDESRPSAEAAPVEGDAS